MSFKIKSEAPLRLRSLSESIDRRSLASVFFPLSISSSASDESCLRSSTTLVRIRERLPIFDNGITVGIKKGMRFQEIPKRQLDDYKR